ncbi:MAG TPA: hypothetical protein VNJ47_05095 [Nevskiales bacterium]|nr:hypothetical protein [Nevskiales bacterium]
MHVNSRYALELPAGRIEMPTLRALVIAFVALSMLGCSTTTQLTRPSPHMLKSRVAEGDSVTVTTKDGSRHVFEVTSVTEDEIRGTNAAVRMDDIEDLEITRLSTGKTALAGMGGVGLAVLVLGTIFVVQTFEDGFRD